MLETRSARSKILGAQTHSLAQPSTRSQHYMGPNQNRGSLNQASGLVATNHPIDQLQPLQLEFYWVDIFQFQDCLNKFELFQIDKITVGFCITQQNVTKDETFFNYQTNELEQTFRMHFLQNFLDLTIILLLQRCCHIYFSFYTISLAFSKDELYTRFRSVQGLVKDREGVAVCNGEKSEIA